MFEYLREKYPTVYVISLPDGTDIPFKPLTYGEFNSYNDKLNSGFKHPSLLEDEIFRKCVLSPAIISNLGRQKAGTISTTVQSIMQVSGPATVELFNERLEENRQVIQMPIHALPVLICRAFPSYTPDDIDNMPFDKMLLRLAQAEAALMQAGLLQQPLLIQPGQVKSEQEKSIAPHELKSAWDRSMNMQKKPIPHDVPIVGIPHEVSPAIEKHSDIMALAKDSLSSGGQDAYSDDSRLRNQMLSDIRWIYPDLVEKVKETQTDKE